MTQQTKEGEARMAALDWAGPYDYRTFFSALDGHLKWWSVKKGALTSEQKPLVEASELKVVPLIAFLANTKGMAPGPKSGEIGATGSLVAAMQSSRLL